MVSNKGAVRRGRSRGAGKGKGKSSNQKATKSRTRRQSPSFRPFATIRTAAPCPLFRIQLDTDDPKKRWREVYQHFKKKFRVAIDYLHELLRVY